MFRCGKISSNISRRNLSLQKVYDEIQCKQLSPIKKFFIRSNFEISIFCHVIKILVILLICAHTRDKDIGYARDRDIEYNSQLQLYSQLPLSIVNPHY